MKMDIHARETRSVYQNRMNLCSKGKTGIGLTQICSGTIYNKTKNNREGKHDERD